MDSKNSGHKTYNIGEIEILLSWKKFTPKTKLKDGIIVFLPGWSLTENSPSIQQICHSFSEYSGQATFAIEAKSMSPSPDSAKKQAEAVKRFINESNLNNLTIVGNSFGGTEGVHLVALLNEEPNIKISGLILLDSVSLYTQTEKELFINFILDNLRTGQDIPLLPLDLKNKNIFTQNVKYALDGVEIIREIVRSNINWPEEIKNEIQQMIHVNPDLGRVQVPVVIIQGDLDLISNPTRIVPNETKDNYITSSKQREEFLKEHIFPKSPYVTMIVLRRMGHHNLSFSRPEGVAQIALDTLSKYEASL